MSDAVRNICDTCETPYVPTAPHYQHCVASPTTTEPETITVQRGAWDTLTREHAEMSSRLTAQAAEGARLREALEEIARLDLYDGDLARARALAALTTETP